MLERLTLAEHDDRDAAHRRVSEKGVGAVLRILTIQQAYARPHAANRLIRRLRRSRKTHRIAQRFDERSEQRCGNGVGRENQDHEGGLGWGIGETQQANAN